MADQTFAYSVLLGLLSTIKIILTLIMQKISLQFIPSHLVFLDIYQFFMYNEGVIFIEFVLFIVVLWGVIRYANI